MPLNQPANAQNTRFNKPGALLSGAAGAVAAATVALVSVATGAGVGAVKPCKAGCSLRDDD
ncbi:MAG: hypothetical protein WBH20_13360 [Oceanisphaera sp.]